MDLRRGERARGASSSGAALLGAIALLALTAPSRIHAAPPDPVARRADVLVRELTDHRRAERALVAILELAGLEDELADRAAVGRAYRRAADDPRVHPEVRALARFRLGLLERSRGDLARSRVELARLGFIEGWSVVGPFDDAGKSGFERAYPPEQPHDAGARFPGKVGEVRWRPVPEEAIHLGFVHLGATVRPAREVVVYARAVVASASARTALLRLGASGAMKVFVNGALVHADPAYHPARLDQVTVRIELRKGANDLLLKLCHTEGRLGFYARLDDAAGASPEALASLQRRARLTGGRDAAQAQYELAFALAERRPNDDNDLRPLDEARRAVELGPRSVQARLLAARLENDANRRRAHLQGALVADGRDVRVLVALAADEEQRGRAVAARGLLERARAIAPGYAPARLALARLWERAGLAARARAERDGAVKDAPWHAGALAAAARSARSAGDQEEAIRLLRRALERRYDDASARAALGQLLVDRGELAGAIALLHQAIGLAPADVDLRVQLGELLASNGRMDDADGAFAAALRIAPDDPEIHERRGQARLRNGRTQEALADFGAALELRPQNAALKELVRALEPARERFEKPYVLDLRETARAAPPPPPDADAVVLGEVQVTRVFPSGLASRFRQIVVQVLNQRGVEGWRTWSATYSPDRQELRVDRARILKPDGTLLEAFDEDDRSTSEPWYRLYYDQRSRHLRFPALAPGDVLEIAIRTDDVAHDNLLADSFGEQVFLSNGTPKRRFDYVLLVPEGRRLQSNDPVAPGVAHETRSLPGALVEHRWTVRDLPRLRPEPGMPGWSEVVPYVHVSTYESWDDVARSYWALVRDQLVPSRPVRALAARLAAEVRAERRGRGAPPEGDELALIQAVHRFVVTNTRYVGLEFGIHGYKPYRVDQVLDRRFGDCKDKASLTHALLEAVGVESRLVLLRMRRLGPVAERPASLAVFNHAILYVPGHDLWLDGTASYAGSHDLPAEDRGASVLVIEPGGRSRLATVPEGRPDENLTASAYEVTLAQDGSAIIRGESRVAGMYAPSWRRAYAVDAERRVQLEQAMARVFPGANVNALSVSDLGRLEDEVSVRFELAHGALAERDGGDLVFQPFGSPYRYAERIAPLSARSHDLVLGPPSEMRFTYRYVLPDGVRPVAVPSPAHVTAPFGRFDVELRSEPGRLVAEGRVVMTSTRVNAAEYPALRAFLGRLDRALAESVRLRRTSGGGR